ncbi:MAG: cytochrome c-type biogenesis CcmF C-terminal domain-containing protein [Actinomycetota bacterium]
MRYIGYLSLLLTAGISIYTAYCFYVGTKARKGEQQQISGSWSIIWQFASATFASLVLILAFLKDDFSFGYVADHSTPLMSPFYKISAFWAGHEGSLLLWLWMLTGYTAVLALSNIKSNHQLKSLALYIANYMQLFLVITMLVASNPFRPALGYTTTGAGLNPLLLHWAMVLHPPTLFMGYAGLTIPFAFAMAALLSRNGSSEWVNLTRSWALVAWFFLTVGMFLGALWAYVVLGWGGYWAWDPVENATLLPWLSGTALLHTFTMYRRRGGMKVWAVGLATFSFAMCIMATFITRSGLIESVHAFPELRWDLTLLFGGLMLVSGLLTIYLLRTRKQEFATQEFFSDFLSRHFTYYLNNLALVVFTLIVLGATVIPPFFKGSLGPDFYNRLAAPLGLLYLLLITICPYLGWTQTDSNKLLRQLIVPGAAAVIAAVLLYPAWGSNLIGYITMVAAVFSIVAILNLFYIMASNRAKSQGIGFAEAFGLTLKNNRARTGGYINHLGVAIIIFGVAGSMLYVKDLPAKIQSQPGQTVQVDNYNLMFKGITSEQRPDQYIYRINFDMTDRQSGKFVRQVAPEYVHHIVQNQQTTRADIIYQPFRDIFIVVNKIDQQGNIYLNIKINPLISFVWIGSFIIIFGTIIAMWPKAVPADKPEVNEIKPAGKAARRKRQPAGV